MTPTTTRTTRDALLAIVMPFTPAIAGLTIVALAVTLPAIVAGFHLIVPVAVLLLATAAIIGLAGRLVGELGVPETDAAIGR